MASTKRVIIVGGDAAGMSAATQAVRTNPGLDVVAYERGPHVLYGACGIPYYVSGEIPDWESLLVMSPEEFGSRGIEARVRHEVVEVRPPAREVTVRDLASGCTFRDHFDVLVLATGGEAALPPWEGVGLRNVFTLRTLEDGVALRTFLDTSGPRRAVVVGGGFVGLEMADALRKRGLGVTVVGQSRKILACFDEAIAGPVLDELKGLGVALRLGTRVTGIEGRGESATGVRSERGLLPADLVLVAVGLKPTSGLAADAGIGLGESGAVSVNDRMQTDAPGVYAAGDCVEVVHVVSGAKVYAPQALTANRTGRIAGDNLACATLGRVSSQRFRGTAGSAVVQVCGFTLGHTGLDVDEAVALGFDATVTVREGRSRAGYYPGGSAIWTQVVVDRRTRRLLGAQMVGREGVAGRINVVASALFSRMTIDDVYGLDLAYAPPFGPVYDPVVDACGRAGLELG